MLRWRISTCARVHASRASRSKMTRSWYLSARIIASSRVFATRGREGDARGLAGLQAHALAQREDGVEHRARRVRERPLFDDGERRGGRAAPPEEAAAVGLVLRRADGLALGADDVDAPDRLVLARTRAAAREQRVLGGDEFRLDEEVAEGRVRHVRGVRREHDLGVARHLDVARARRLVRQRDATNLGVVLGRDDDLGVRDDTVVGAEDVNLVFREGDFVGARPARGRLIPGRPDGAACARRAGSRRSRSGRARRPRASA